MIEVKIEDRASRMFLCWLKVSLMIITILATFVAGTYFSGALMAAWTGETWPGVVTGAIVAIAQVIAAIVTGVKDDNGEFKRS